MQGVVKESERREGERFARCVPVKCRTASHSTLETSTLDISTTGMRMEARHNFRVGHQLTLHLRPAESRFLSIQAEVVWARPRNGTSAYEVGLRFLQILPADFAWMKKWLGVKETKAGTQRLNRDAARPPVEPKKLQIVTAPINGNNAPSSPPKVAVAPARHRCQCGEEFRLKVELALHCESHQHQPWTGSVAAETPAKAVAPSAKPKGSVRTRLALLLVLAGVIAGSYASGALLEAYYKYQASRTHVVHYL